MEIRVEVLSQRKHVQERLRRSGWRLKSTSQNCVVATHPRVTKESEARLWLHQIGLLTSAAARISFGGC